MTRSSIARSGIILIAMFANNAAKGRKITALAVAQMVAALAIWRGTSSASRSTPCRCAATGETASASPASAVMNGSQIRAPNTLNSTCTAAARFASWGLLIAASIAVIPVPIFAPKRMAMPAGRESNPWVAMTTARPIVAEDDCTRVMSPALTKPTTSTVVTESVKPN